MIRKKILVSCILIAMALLAGCGKDASEQTVTSGTMTGENEIDIYYHDGYRIEKKEERYQLMQPDSLSQSVEEVLTQLMQVYDNRLENYSYLLDEDNHLTLELLVNGELSGEDDLLLKAAISKTLFQLPEVKSIEMVLEDGNGEITFHDAFTRDSFYYFTTN